MKRIIDIIAKYVFTVSGFTTSVVILLIIGFLFTEAVGLFKNNIVEDGYVLALNKDNPVEGLSAHQIKLLFDEEITNWKEINGKDLPVETFRLEDLTRYYSEKELGAEYELAGDKNSGHCGFYSYDVDRRTTGCFSNSGSYYSG